jgi:hypothetical protein
METMACLGVWMGDKKVNLTEYRGSGFILAITSTFTNQKKAEALIHSKMHHIPLQLQKAVQQYFHVIKQVINPIT